MDEAVVVQADVDEGTEVRDVADGAAQDGARLEVGELDDGLARQRGRQIGARVAPWAREGVEDVVDRRQAGLKRCGELALAALI